MCCLYWDAVGTSATDTVFHSLRMTLLLRLLLSLSLYRCWSVKVLAVYVARFPRDYVPCEKSSCEADISLDSYISCIVVGNADAHILFVCTCRFTHEYLLICIHMYMYMHVLA